MILLHCNNFSIIGDLKKLVCYDIQTNTGNREWLCERAILAPTNETLRQINDQIMVHVEDNIVEYLLLDNIMNTEQVTSYSQLFRIQRSAFIQVETENWYSNLDVPKLFNDTRLQVTHLGCNIIKAIIMTEMTKVVPTNLPLQFKRSVFPKPHLQ